MKEIEGTFPIKINDKNFNAINICWYDQPLDFYIEETKCYLRLIDEFKNNDNKDIYLWIFIENFESKDVNMEYDEIIKLDHKLLYENLELNCFCDYNEKYEFN